MTLMTQQAPPRTTPTASSHGIERRPLNVVGLISLITATLGLVLACIPGAWILGWILLPTGFILGLVSMFKKDRSKALGIIGLIVSIIGTIGAAIVFFVVFFTSFNNAIDNEADPGPAVEQPATAAGTSDDPYPLGTVVTSEEWEVTINDVTFNATDLVVAENPINEPPRAGHEYILVNATITYVGDDESGGMPGFVAIEYVGPDGDTVTTASSLAVAPDQLEVGATLEPGESVNGNVVLTVPSAGAADGLVAIAPGMFGDAVYYATS